MQKKKSRKGLIIGIILILLAAAVLLAAIFIKDKLNKIHYSDGEPKETAEEADTEKTDDGLHPDISDLEKAENSDAPAGEAEEKEGILNILLLGTDERGLEFNDSARADCIMVLSLNMNDGTAKLMSFERAIGVKMYGGRYEGKVDLLTHCFHWGGANLMMREIQEYFKIDVDRYIRVNFAALAKIVDCLGGIDVELSHREVCGLLYHSGSDRTGTYNKQGKFVSYSDHPQLSFEDGVNHLYGPAALAFARLRLIDSDWNRVERQRKVVQACVDSVKDADLKTLNNLCDEILPMIETNFTQTEIIKLMLKAPKFLGVKFDQLTVPVDRETMQGTRIFSGGAAFAPDYELNAKVVNEFIYGDRNIDEYIEELMAEKRR